MHTKVLIVSSVAKWLDQVYYNSNAIILGCCVSRISSAEVCHRYATCVSLIFCHELLITNSTYSIQIPAIASTKNIPMYKCHKYC